MKKEKRDETLAISIARKDLEATKVRENIFISSSKMSKMSDVVKPQSWEEIAAETSSHKHRAS